MSIALFKESLLDFLIFKPAQKLVSYKFIFPGI
jgi:hypothetical protein